MIKEIIYLWVAPQDKAWESIVTNSNRQKEEEVVEIKRRSLSQRRSSL